MAYCGAIGNVNVLEFMSTELFDEAQENPFLLQRPLSVSPSKQRQQGLGDGLAAHSSPQRRSFAAKVLELPLHDPQDSVSSAPHVPPHYSQYQQQQYNVESPPAVPTYSAPSPSDRASVTFHLPKSILKRQSSYESDLSTVASDLEPMAAAAATAVVDVDVNETELHKLLYSLARFSVASETSACSMADSPSKSHSMSQPMSPVPASAHAGLLWFRDSNSGSPEYEHERSARSPSRANVHASQQCHSTGRAVLKSRHGVAKQKTQRARSADRAGYETDPDSDYDEDDYYYDDNDGYDSASGRCAMRSRKSVTFETVKNLLRGGGTGRASRIVQRAIPDQRRKSMGTVSSRLKCRQKFTRPTILTDAYHRVSTMKLGTKPMPVKVKHLAFPELFDPSAAESETDPGMSSPKGQLRAASLVLLDTLDKIGTRAACPVHLLDEGSPDYSNVPARVDSHNRIARSKSGLRRPSAWLMT